MRTRKKVALLGFAERCSMANLLRARELGQALTQRGFALVCGNNRSTFRAALRGASCQFRRYQAIEVITPDLSDTVVTEEQIICQTQTEKHDQLISLADCAIILGGGPHTLKLSKLFYLEGKKIVAIKGTGGVVRWELPSFVTRMNNEQEAIDYLACASGHRPTWRNPPVLST